MHPERRLGAAAGKAKREGLRLIIGSEQVRAEADTGDGGLAFIGTQQQLIDEAVVICHAGEHGGDFRDDHKFLQVNKSQ